MMRSKVEAFTGFNDKNLKSYRHMVNYYENWLENRIRQLTKESENLIIIIKHLKSPNKCCKMPIPIVDIELSPDFRIIMVLKIDKLNYSCF